MSDQMRIPGWKGNLSRVDAEHELESKPIGTYLIREVDEITRSSLFHMAEENHLKVKAYLITVVESEEKISDILVIKTTKGWSLYHDDPNLKDSKLYQYAKTVKSLLSKIPSAWKPIL